MAATSTSIIRTATASMQVSGTRTYSVLYRVITSDKDDQAVTAITASGIPSIGQYYQAGNDWDTGAFVRGYSAALQDEDGDNKTWLVTVDYSTVDGQKDPKDDPLQLDTPWTSAARVSGSGLEEEVETVLHYTNPLDKNSVEVVRNSADEMTASRITAIRTTPSVIIEKDFLTWPDSLEDYINAINTATFFGQPAGTYRMGYPRWQRLYTGEGVKYFNIVFEFFMNAEGWNGQKVQDKGTRVRDPNNSSELTHATDGLGNPIWDAVLMDGAGYQLGWFSAPVNFPTAGINEYLEKDFGDLGIPTER